MTTFKTRIIAWLLYSVGAFLLLLIGFTWQISLPVSIIIGFFGMMFNEVIQILRTMVADDDEDYEERKAGRRI